MRADRGGFDAGFAVLTRVLPSEADEAEPLPTDVEDLRPWTGFIVGRTVEDTT